jgi:hypothetical protein
MSHTLGKARLLVGHVLDHNLDMLGMGCLAYLKCDTAMYQSLMKTSNLSNSLKLTSKERSACGLQERKETQRSKKIEDARGTTHEEDGRRSVGGTSVFRVQESIRRNFRRELDVELS